ncbi:MULTISPECIES: hypothetical protein [Paenibacillus]|uniref:hypothetical protein n=1 Tax=Paenibacillus TaxID=44249 RepID=UPI00030917FF|nr:MULTISPECIES: hypothetical protein [Paenibacillus]KKD54683.1 hypothetical protein C400_11970 [Paenibacillus sp. ICGEB2008]NMP12047.1 hypothetical protein [Paenibacillus polymyxa]
MSIQTFDSWSRPSVRPPRAISAGDSDCTDVIEVLRLSGSEPDVQRIAQGLRYDQEYDAFME